MENRNMINPQDFSKSKPVIKAAELGGAKVAVLTVEHAEQIELGGDPKIVMQFEEFPEIPGDKDAPRNYFPNLTSIRNLVDGLGDDEKKWPKKLVVLEIIKTNDPTKKRQVDALWVAAADTWSGHIKAVGKKPDTPAPAARKSGKKR
jgi:hypothetical protein